MNWKRFSCLIIFGLVISCTSLRKSSTQSPLLTQTWNEKNNRSFKLVTFGIPAFNETLINYKRGGAALFSIRLTKPRVIVVADKPQKWGYYQFPTITRLKDGTLHAEWSMHADAIESYGTNAVGSSLSGDAGNTWKAGIPDSSVLNGYTLPNGDIIKVVDPKPIKISELNMPPPVGKTNFKYRKTNFTFYRLKEMPEERNGVFLTRLKSGTGKWKQERASLDDPMGVRYSSRDLVPVVWWGDLHTMPDQSVLAGVYPGFYLKEDGVLDKQMGVVFYRSTDNGHSWKIQSRISFTPDTSLDSMYADRIGFSEPAYEILADGSLLCVIRSADGDGVTNGVGNGPLYASRSVDMGLTWTKPRVIAPAGVLPRLLLLKNGVTVLASGRPGVQLRFMQGDAKAAWTDPLEMLPYESQSLQEQYAVSCGYTGLVATGPDRFIIIYSD
ncbi:MAG: sialidase family protein, partial [Chitinophagaceae bacterium]